jgi:hypothetical protein
LDEDVHGLNVSAAAVWARRSLPLLVLNYAGFNSYHVDGMELPTWERVDFSTRHAEGRTFADLLWALNAIQHEHTAPAPAVELRFSTDFSFLAFDARKESRRNNSVFLQHFHTPSAVPKNRYWPLPLFRMIPNTVTACVGHVLPSLLARIRGPAAILASDARLHSVAAARMCADGECEVWVLCRPAESWTVNWQLWKRKHTVADYHAFFEDEYFARRLRATDAANILVQVLDAVAWEDVRQQRSAVPGAPTWHSVLLGPGTDTVGFRRFWLSELRALLL